MLHQNDAALARAAFVSGVQRQAQRGSPGPGQEITVPEVRPFPAAGAAPEVLKVLPASSIFPKSLSCLARATGLEPATTGSTVRYSNQLSYAPKEISTVSAVPC